MDRSTCGAQAWRLSLLHYYIAVYSHIGTMRMKLMNVFEHFGIIVWHESLSHDNLWNNYIDKIFVFKLIITIYE